MNKVVIVDIDHTLADAEWRDSLIGGHFIADWTAPRVDGPIWFIATIVRHLMAVQTLDLVGITSLPEQYRARTAVWLRKQQIVLDDLIMNDGKSKLAQIAERFEVEEIAFVIDEDEDAAKAMQSVGISVLRPCLGREP